MNHIAPVQGHTDAAWRHFHHDVYGTKDIYYTPFIRNEKGGIRDRDMRDFTSALIRGTELVPQVIFKNMEELRPLLTLLRKAGAVRVDLNMGCPFPLQTARGRGAAFLGNDEEMAKLPETLDAFPDIDFSAKLRLGFSDPEEWQKAMPVLNVLRLKHITLHPRVAKEQYGGDLHYDQFERMLEMSQNPVVFNGEIRTPGDFARVSERFPGIAGIMSGRGVLARPSLTSEVESGDEWDHIQRIETMLRFHQLLFAHYEENLCGESQVIAKIKPFWEYAETEIGRKAWKSIKKASNIAKYHSAVAMIGN